MGKKINFKKLDADDILEIILEHFQNSEKDCEFAKGILLGTAGKDLRFVGVFGKENDSQLKNYDLIKLDENMDYNGDHSFLKDNPDFQIQTSKCIKPKGD